MSRMSNSRPRAGDIESHSLLPPSFEVLQAPNGQCQQREGQFASRTTSSRIRPSDWKLVLQKQIICHDINCTRIAMNRSDLG
jgi:hypothetical protein